MRKSLVACFTIFALAQFGWFLAVVTPQLAIRSDEARIRSVLELLVFRHASVSDAFRMLKQEGLNYQQVPKDSQSGPPESEEFTIGLSAPREHSAEVRAVLRFDDGRASQFAVYSVSRNL